MSEPRLEGPTLGEIHRLLLAMNLNVEALRADMKAESHSTRNKLGSLEVRIETLGVRVESLEGGAQSWWAAIAGIISGAIAGVLARIVRP